VAEELKLRDGYASNLRNVVRHPRSALIFSGAVECLCSLERLDVEICDVVPAVGQLHADLELLVQHHVVLQQSARSIVNAQDPFLHLHFVGRTTPADWIVLPLLAPARCERNTALRKGQAGATSLRDFVWIATPGLRTSTPGVC